ncbi:RsmB/NOP family class I SAM-dependent RNA methyltransferase [Noviherbaspirillum pedocola]|uniref:RsmB/NOP family class I SAM-dependent RNA methyltransferase n=1 Tax=Noviherbaspirillum pedocola TaxID=2801341 RepID=A0A934SYQ9_9BURK|nr:RsmB/NOP family class I SAM-dependent RNA methyltransferase [Noviherbaspirillum pedocola]MBK4737481.1 RsmB/NOP family class I SAM-dependent RNA methyltransferase [Noviherbaspirillum pedocola]
MRLPPAVVSHTEEVLREVLRFTGPADGTLSRYFREHPRLGGRERGMIAESIYAVLRNKLVYTNFAESGTGPAMRRLVLLGLADVAGVEAISGLSPEETAWLERVIRVDREALQPQLKANLPEWLYRKLAQDVGEDGVIKMARVLNSPAPLDLRVNILKVSREEAIAELAKVPLQCELPPYAASALRIYKKPALQNLPIFKSGGIEVQDEGSQVLAQLVGARRGEMVVDFCAGAGGKTLALGAIMRNTGRLYAFDVSEKRLAKLKPRLARSGLSNVHPTVIAHENDAKVKRLAGKIDRVLVDAPCSGLGTLRRNPDVKWRMQPQAIAELNEKQFSILSGASRLVKPGGRLVYATCSILSEENEAIVERFLATHSAFQLVPVKQVLEEQGIPLEMENYLKLLPQVHNTDGFFAAVLERRQ